MLDGVVARVAATYVLRVYYIFTHEAAVARNQFFHSLVGTFQPINTVTEYHARDV